ncbi:MAG: ArsR/SmtB family transcription factor [Candidatus Fervidibacter sp.]|uniref:ArsR/SmtB family transcription factor n=1 Tax=Candidatus Fervidibacter sp. TaxID=3100871 RepID=UPI0040490172
MRGREAIKAEDCAKFLKAIGEEARLKIIALLFRRGMSVKELVKQLNLSQPLVSHHLSVLRSANIVKSRKVGRKIFYSLNPEFWREFEQGEEIDLGCCSLRFRLPTFVSWVELDEGKTESGGEKGGSPSR